MTKNHFLRLFSSIFIPCILLLSLPLHAQKKTTVSGYIKDDATGESLIGVSVYIKELKAGAITNPYGFYSITVEPGKYTLTFSYVGYTSTEQQIDLSQSNQSVDVRLNAADEQLDEVVVTGEREDANIANVEMSVEKLNIKTIQKMPALLGEVDIIKSIQLLPGVSTVGEGASGFNVRGGGVGQNLVLLDEAPVYNSSHLFGFFSVFNPDAVKDVKLIKGGIPSQYGGRLSSILDVRMKEGNDNQFSGQGGVGLIFSRLTLEAPIVENKASFIIAGRRSYADILAQPFLSDDLKNSVFNFYDVTGKVNWNINEKNKVFLSAYLGRDVFEAADLFGFNWGNSTVSARWNHLFNEKLFFNTTAFYSNYDYKLSFGNDDDSFNWKANIQTYSVKPEFTLYANTNNTLTFGANSILYKFSPGETQTVVANNEIPPYILPEMYGVESAAYIGNEQNINKSISLQYGLRLSTFSYLGETTTYEFAAPEKPGYGREPIASSAQSYEQWESVKTYWNLEPRFSAKFQLNESSSIKASYNRTAQYIHLISNTSASSPLDIWYPSTKNVKPEIADQVALGIFKNLKNNMYETSVEVYYKDMSQLVDYVVDADLLLNEYIEGDLLESKGRAYGAEFYVKKTKGKFHGWTSYTLSKTERLTDDINNNEWYNARFDQTHNVRLVSFYDLNEKWSFSGSFTYVSGTPASFPTNTYEIQGYSPPHNPDDSRNNYRIPAYHRLDLSATLTPSKKNHRWKNYESYWVFSLYNVYNRRNPFSISFNPNSDRMPYGVTDNQATQLSIIGSVIPSVSYNFKF
ncbi:TonB-dependent receptor [Limibacter armeniacum]|uniref:TonB-dependent receptor n=1 Tax=Limibacter armeniacum TaxID=466084 RepID=UPI002FE6A668